MQSAIAECVSDRYAVGMEAVRRNLGLANHATAQVMQEIHGAFHGALADAPANDCLLCPGHACENVLIALGRDLMALDVLLLLADRAISSSCYFGFSEIFLDGPVEAAIE